MLDNIPIYRAKSRTTDLDTYGHLFKSQKATFIIPICEYNEEIEEFDFIKVFEPIFEDTVAIHFPNMLASDSDRYLPNGEKDLRIFASLQKDGKGGDICESKWFNIDAGLTVKTESVRYSNNTMLQDGYNISRYEYKKIIGIQE